MSILQICALLLCIHWSNAHNDSIPQADDSRGVFKDHSSSQTCSPLDRDLSNQTLSRMICQAPLIYNDQCRKYNPYEEWLNPCYCAESETPDHGHKILCCDFAFQGAGLSHANLTQPAVHLINALNLSLRVNSQTVRSLHVINSTNAVLTMNRNEFTQFGSKFSAINSTGRFLPRFGTVSLYRSRFYALEDNLASEAISLVESSLIRASNISSLLDEGEKSCYHENYYCFVTEKTEIIRLKNIHLKCSALFRQSNFSVINSLRFDALYVMDSNIGIIFPGGLSVTEAGLSMTNVRIRYLHRESIIAGPNSTISLTNVTVDHCDEPCFQIRKDILLKNVTLNRRVLNSVKDGAIINITSWHLHAIEMDDFNCPEKAGTRLCNYPLLFPPAWNLTAVDFYPVRGRPEPPKNVIIANQTKFRVLEGCQKSIHLKNFTGSYYPWWRSSCTSRIPLRITNSSLSALVSTEVDVLEVAGSTKIDFLNIPFPLRSFEARDLILGKVGSLKFKNKENGEFQYFGGTIGVVRNLVIYSPKVHFSNVSIHKIRDFKLKYKTPSAEPVRMTNCEIDWVREHGISVERGPLVLRNNKFRNLNHEMIRIGEYGTLILHDVDSDFKRHCKLRGPLISALYRHQVVVGSRLAPAWLWKCINYRKTLPCYPPKILPLSRDFSCLNPLSNCSRKDAGSYLCQLSSVAGTVVLGNTPALNEVKEIQIHDARALAIGRHCIKKVFLNRCNVTHVLEYAWSCSTNLEVHHSTMTNIGNNIWKLHLNRSSVGNLNLNKVDEMKIEHSNVSQLVVDSISRGSVESSKVLRITRTQISKNLTISSCNITHFDKTVVQKGASLTISNANIGVFAMPAILVKGSLILETVTVKSPIAGSILIARGGRLKCSNLTGLGRSDVHTIFVWKDPKERPVRICFP